MAYIVGKKIGMTRIFTDDGTVVPVTVIQAEPGIITQLRTKEKDRYEAVQIGFGTKKRVNKPMAGHLKESGGSSRYLRESRVMTKDDGTAFAVGDVFDVSVFSAGALVKVTGIAKAKGFQGAVKRHGFAGLPASHGHHHVMRHVGSIGQRFPQHTLKGSRGPGRTGGKQITTRGLRVISVDTDKQQLLVKGAVPGRKGTLLAINTIA